MREESRQPFLAPLTALLAVLAVALWVLWPSLQALLVLDDLFPLGPHPLDLTARPSVRAVPGIEADLYVPAGGGRHPALLIVNGAVYQGRKYGPLVGAATAFARDGFVVMVPELGRLRQYIVGPEIVADTVKAIELLRRQPQVAPGPVGVYGFSIGGSFALLAAENPSVSSQLAFVGDISGYYSLTDMIQAATTGIAPPDGRHVKLDRVVALTLAGSLIARLPPGHDRDLLQHALSRYANSANPLAGLLRLSDSQLAPADRPVLDLLQNHDPARVPSLIAAQPPALAPLLQLSPATHLERIRAPVFVVHDESDPYVPVEESKQLAADPRLHGRVQLSITTILQHTQFDLSKLTAGDLINTYLPNLHLIEHFILVTLARLH